MPRSDDELEELLSRPPASLVSLLSTLSGDFLILGAGGKMGPSLARMMKRAAPERRVTAVSRWTDERAAVMLRAAGVETMSADLLDPRALAALPDTENVIYMAGQKFGTTGNPAMTVSTPGHVSHVSGSTRLLLRDMTHPRRSSGSTMRTTSGMAC